MDNQLTVEIDKTPIEKCCERNQKPLRDSFDSHGCIYCKNKIENYQREIQKYKMTIIQQEFDLEGLSKSFEELSAREKNLEQMCNELKEKVDDLIGLEKFLTA